MKLAIEMGGDGRKYGVIHKAGCRDLRDGMPLGEATTRDEAAALAEDACNWGYEADEWTFAPCAKTVEGK